MKVLADYIIEQRVKFLTVTTSSKKIKMMKSALVLLVALGVATALPRPEFARYLRGPGIRQDCEPTPDPNILPPNNVNLSLTPVLEIFEGSSHEGAVLTGASGITTDIQIILITLTLHIELTIPSLDIEATGAQATGYLDGRPLTCLPSGNFSAVGDDGKAHISNLYVDARATLFINLITNKVNIRLLTVNSFRFDDICLDLGPNFRIAGEAVDFVDFCENFKSRFDVEYANAAIRDPVIEKIRGAANNIVGKFTIDELIDLIGGGGDC